MTKNIVFNNNKCFRPGKYLCYCSIRVDTKRVIPCGKAAYVDVILQVGIALALRTPSQEASAAKLSQRGIYQIHSASSVSAHACVEAAKPSPETTRQLRELTPLTARIDSATGDLPCISQSHLIGSAVGERPHSPSKLLRRIVTNSGRWALHDRRARRPASVGHGARAGVERGASVGHGARVRMRGGRGYGRRRAREDWRTQAS